MIATTSGRRPAAPALRASRASAAASSSASSRGVPGDDVQPDRIGPGPDGGEDAVGIGDAADLHGRPARDVGRVVGLRTGRDEGPDGSGRIRCPDERLADERAIEPERPPAGDEPGLTDARFGDDEPVVGHELAQSRRLVDIDLERAQVAVVEPDQPGAAGQGAVQLARIVDLDQRLQADLERPLDQPGEPPRPDGGPRAAGRGRRRPRAASGAGSPRPRSPWPGPGRRRPPGPPAGRRPNPRTSAARTGPRSPRRRPPRRPGRARRCPRRPRRSGRPTATSA